MFYFTNRFTNLKRYPLQKICLERLIHRRSRPLLGTNCTYQHSNGPNEAEIKKKKKKSIIFRKLLPIQSLSINIFIYLDEHRIFWKHFLKLVETYWNQSDPINIRQTYNFLCFEDFLSDFPSRSDSVMNGIKNFFKLN